MKSNRKIHYAFILLGLLGPVIPFFAWSDFTFWIGKMIFILAIIFCLGLAIFWFGIGVLSIFRKDKNKKIEGMLFLFIPVSIILSFIALRPLVAIPIQSLGIHSAQPLLAAVEKFYQDNGIYPEDLQELIPLYLEKIPSSPFFKENGFVYSRGDGETFRITFFIPRKKLIDNSYRAIMYKKPAIRGDNFTTSQNPEHKYWKEIGDDWFRSVKHYR